MAQTLGAGLGLSLCRRLVDSLGGTIGLRSELDRGTEVVVTLPVPAGVSS